ncbi:uncharacterized protein IUM83_05731 [Phytophthora cinnamomi]|uniref:uncharacterized protein n=1 Tax=Phytophthora cinnamomi TaxID=4785 RepID=UPI0035596E86|nr:hypothetical protein IUM83_05731 [Phytophthora cinnamomi]
MLDRRPIPHTSSAITAAKRTSKTAPALIMPSGARASTSPRVLTPSQASVQTLHAGSSSPLSSPSASNARGRRSSFVPLQRLECVRVAKNLRRNGHRLYVAGVFYKRSEARRRLSDCVYKASAASKLSPEAMRALMMAEREPDYVVERRFSEFRQLRDSVAALVRAHGAECADCQDLQHVMLGPQHQNWTVKRMFGNKEQRFALLTTFLNDLVALTDERHSCGSIAEDIGGVGGKRCSARDRVAELLQKFIKRNYQPSLGII